MITTVQALTALPGSTMAARGCLLRRNLEEHPGGSGGRGLERADWRVRDDGAQAA